VCRFLGLIELSLSPCRCAAVSQDHSRLAHAITDTVNSTHERLQRRADEAADRLRSLEQRLRDVDSSSQQRCAQIDTEFGRVAQQVPAGYFSVSAGPGVVHRDRRLSIRVQTSFPFLSAVPAVGDGSGQQLRGARARSTLPCSGE
jgi:hypothetical protein